MPLQPVMGAVRQEDGEQSLGAVLERSSTKVPTFVQERSGSLGHEGAKASPSHSLHPNDVHTGPFFLHHPFAGAGVAGSDVLPSQQHCGGIARWHCRVPSML